MSLTSFQIISSTLAVEPDGYGPEEIQVQRGGFWERVFDPDPTLPLWQLTKPKIVQRPKYKPAMYQLGNQLIAHPALVEMLERELIKVPKHGSNHIYSW